MHVGFGNILCANCIVAILISNSASTKRLTRAAKEKKLFFDLTSGRTTKSILLLDDGKLVGCALTPRTISQRIQSLGGEEEIEGDNSDENHTATGRPVDAK